MPRMNARLIEQLTATIRGALPANLPQDVERHVRAALEAAFAKMQLVTREEFEVQQAVLQRTRALLERLERQVAALENKPPRDD